MMEQMIRVCVWRKERERLAAEGQVKERNGSRPTEQKWGILYPHDNAFGRRTTKACHRGCTGGPQCADYAFDAKTKES